MTVFFLLSNPISNSDQSPGYGVSDGFVQMQVPHRERTVIDKMDIQYHGLGKITSSLVMPRSDRSGQPILSELTRSQSR